MYGNDNFIFQRRFELLNPLRRVIVGNRSEHFEMLSNPFYDGRFAAGLFAGLAVVLTLTGCSPKDPIGKRVKVEGIVSVDGNPLPNGSLSFRALEDKGNTQKHEPYAIIEPDGKYKIMTLGKEGFRPRLVPSRRGIDRAAPRRQDGEHRIAHRPKV